MFQGPQGHRAQSTEPISNPRTAGSTTENRENYRQEFPSRISRLEQACTPCPSVRSVSERAGSGGVGGLWLSQNQV